MRVRRSNYFTKIYILTNKFKKEKMKQIILTMAMTLAISAAALAQEDAEGCKDHPMFSRLSNFNISECSKNFNEIQFYTSAENTIAKEGTVTKLTYIFNDDPESKSPSPYQVIKNYENAIMKNNGKKIYSSTGNDGYQGATFTLTTNGIEYWVMIDNMVPGHPDICYGFDLYILEIEAMKQEIQANEIFEALNKNGFIALHINFATDKSDIKPESQKIIDQIVEMLKSNPSLKISIEGHTDNVGSSASNKTLSENRAKSVMTAIITQGIDKTRLSAKGFGQEKPIAENSTEDGRAKNRRVEIVKQ
jgi:outer membrane protein OmpA-like peptidoglycan-associated protein